MADDKELYQRKNGFILCKNYINSVNKILRSCSGNTQKIQCLLDVGMV